MKLYPYKQGSAGAKALADALGCTVLRHEGKHRKEPLVLNWGCSNITRSMDVVTFLNPQQAVARASNKLEAFKALSQAGVSIPAWSDDFTLAADWHIAGDLLVARQKLNGHSGEGIVIINKDDYFEIAPLYTKYIKKKEEYRIHVFQGEAFFVQRKARKLDVAAEEVNWKVRNLAGGFIFAHKDVEVDDVARVQAVNAVRALALDFGAVDIIHGTDGVFYVLEVNTAPGLQGATLDAYVKQLEKFK